MEGWIDRTGVLILKRNGTAVVSLCPFNRPNWSPECSDTCPMFGDVEALNEASEDLLKLACNGVSIRILEDARNNQAVLKLSPRLSLAMDGGTVQWEMSAESPADREQP